MDCQPIQRHSWPENDGKRTRSPNQLRENIKKSRSVYLVESPGGTLRQESPTKAYKPQIAKLRHTSLPERSINPKKPTERKLFQEQPPVKPTVYDLLMMGIKRGAEREEAHRAQMHRAFQYDPQLRLVSPLQDSSTVVGMQNAVDRAMHMSHELSPEQIARDGALKKLGSDAVYHDIHDRRPGQGTVGRAEHRTVRKQRRAHYEDREHFTVSSSKRMQTALGLLNFYPYSPLPVLPMYSDPNHGLKVEGHMKEIPTLHATLKAAGRTHGYRKLELDSLVFNQMVDLNYTIVGLDQDADNWAQATTPLMSLDAKKGQITLYETNLIDGFGQRRSWMWFEIIKPLFAVEGRRPTQFWDMADSRLVFAIPTLQVMKLKDE